jgi:membrane-bound lytic murein transglycosylase D
MVRLAACLLVTALLAGCSHLSVPFGAGEGSARTGPDPDAGATLAADEQVREAISSLEALAEAAQAQPAPEMRPEDYTDVFARMRSGFSLPVIEDPRVERQLAWYAAHPDYLDRAFLRGRRYLHHIVEQLEQRDMPRELALLPVVESAFDPFAISSSRAAGLWQFMPRTGRHYGLEQDWWADGRRDVLAATDAALQHLEDLHAEFDGDWLLALAAYNAGSGSVRRAMDRNRRAGKPTDFFHLPLKAETRAYVPKLLAIAQLASEPERFGIEFPTIPNAPYFELVDVGGQIDLGRVADLAGIPIDELRALNPEYKRWATAPDGPHELLMPAPTSENFLQALATLPAAERLRFTRHTVRRGDTLIAIAKRYGVSVEALRTVNRVRGSLIRPGQELLVPVPAESTADARPRPRVDRDS